MSSKKNCWRDALLLTKFLLSGSHVLKTQNDRTLDMLLLIIDEEDKTTFDNTLCLCNYFTREGFRDSVIDLKNFILNACL